MCVYVCVCVQLVLETRQDAAAKVKASIEEYQTRAHAVSEKVDLMRAQLETAARNDLAALRDDYEVHTCASPCLKFSSLSTYVRCLHDMHTHIHAQSHITRYAHIDIS